MKSQGNNKKPASSQIPNWIPQNMISKKIQKGDFLQKAGNKSTQAFYVKSGLLRSYIIDEKGKEHIFLFAPEGWVITDATEVGRTSELYVDALENSTIIVIDKEVAIPNLNIKVLLKRIFVLQNRVIMLMSHTASKRYEHFLETYPNVAERVPQKMIASYLGITPEALSNIRKKMIS